MQKCGGSQGERKGGVTCEEGQVQWTGGWKLTFSIKHVKLQGSLLELAPHQKKRVVLGIPELCFK